MFPLDVGCDRCFRNCRSEDRARSASSPVHQGDSEDVPCQAPGGAEGQNRVCRVLGIEP